MCIFKQSETKVIRLTNYALHDNEKGFFFMLLNSFLYKQNLFIACEKIVWLSQFAKLWTLESMVWITYLTFLATCLASKSEYPVYEIATFHSENTRFKSVNINIEH